MKPECARVMDALGGPLPPELATHAASCEDCRAITEGFGALGALPKVPPSEPPEHSRTQALRELAVQPRAAPWWRELLVLLAVFGGVMVGGLFVLGRKGMVRNTASPVIVAGLALLILALVGGGAFIALAPARRRPAWGLMGVGAAGVTLFQILGGSDYVVMRSFLTGVMGCLVTEVALTVPPLVVTLVLLCRSVFQPLRALAAGLAAAGVGLFVLHLHCSDGSAAHLALGHVAPWLLLSVVTLLLRARLPSRTYAP
ncbi:NrsF family protein [Stigmatella sp. ncwal1]|uniref:NrsF family protein n=1 Tax=Stigmatella ashevillensis TaxID=2995309 RepID=A0ABT5DJ78_9BACT|nr:NrsF family protein [Stigmatella ashevillena]MDC0713712.1 NrsF family protein [Stigmatella ashevillena]